MLKVYEYMNSDWGKAFTRISHAFRDYSYGKLEFTSNKRDADRFIVHCVGTEEIPVANSFDHSKSIIIQHCVKTTGAPIELWKRLWKSSALVVAFNDLTEYDIQDTNFLRLPWGADPKRFFTRDCEKTIKVFATGHVANTEMLDRVYEACRLTNNLMCHTGENFHWDNQYYKFSEYMDDTLFSECLSKTQFIPCLREIEGFELMGIEGAMCGATPIVLNLSSYDFYKDFAIVVDSNKPIVEQLVSVLSEPYIPLSKEKVDFVRNEFSWETIVNKLADRILET